MLFWNSKSHIPHGFLSCDYDYTFVFFNLHLVSFQNPPGGWCIPSWKIHGSIWIPGWVTQLRKKKDASNVRRCPCLVAGKNHIFFHGSSWIAKKTRVKLDVYSLYIWKNICTSWVYRLIIETVPLCTLWATHLIEVEKTHVKIYINFIKDTLIWY